MGYQFKLEALRRYRQFQETELQRELADTLRLKDQALSLLNSYESQLEQTRKELYRQQGDSIQGAQLAIFPRYLEKITTAISEQQLNIEAIEKQSEAVREALLEAVQKRKTLEKLKEKGLNAYLANLSFEEQKFINEMAINRFNLKDR